MAKTSKSAAAKNIPDCAATPDQRTQIGSHLQQLVYAGLQQKGNVESWWATVEQYHRNEWNEFDKPAESLSAISIPYSQPRQDMLTAQVCSVVGRQEPYMLCTDLAGNEAEEKKEKTLHAFWKAAKFETAIRKCSHICSDTNKVWYRLAWDLNPNVFYGGFLFDVIHPRNTCIFPATLEGIQNARLLAHRFYRRLADIKALQRRGVYFDDRVPNAGSSPEEYDTSGEIINSGASPSIAGPDPDDLRVECWDCLIKYADPEKDEDEKWYQATFAFKDSCLLSFQPYPYSRPWYFDASYITTNEEGYWSGVSVGRNLSGLQDAVNKMHSAIYNGSMMAAYPPIFGPEMPEKDFEYQYGDFVPQDMPGQNWSPTITFKGDPLIRNLEMYDEIGDKTARISNNTQGTVQGRATTATQDSIIAAGVQTGIEEYIATFSECFPEMAAFTCELLAYHFAEWGPVYAERLQITKEDLLRPTQWEPNGKSPGNTPGAKIAAIQQLIAVAESPIGPMTGLDPYDMVKVLIANLGLVGADNLQMPKPQGVPNASQPPPGPNQSPGLPGPPGVLPPPSGIPGQAAPPVGP